MNSYLVALILGVIEGVTEFLPVSSTGHLLLAESFLPRQSDTFNVVIQSGAVLAVLFVFSGRIKELFTQYQNPQTRDYILKLGGAFLITVLGGLVLHFTHFELPETTLPVALATLFGGILIILIENMKKRERGQISWRVAIAAGLFQIAAALFPGLSRSGAVILGSMAFGLGRPPATEFAFLLGVPTLLAAGGLKIFSGVASGTFSTENSAALLIGTLSAAVTAFIVVRWLLTFVQTHRFTVFGWYRILLGILLLLLA